MLGEVERKRGGQQQSTVNGRSYKGVCQWNTRKTGFGTVPHGKNLSVWLRVLLAHNQPNLSMLLSQGWNEMV